MSAGSSRAASSQIELAVHHASRDRTPLSRGEDQRGPTGVAPVPHRDHVVAAFLGAGDDGYLDAGTVLPATVGRPAPRGAGKVHVAYASLVQVDTHPLVRILISSPRLQR